MPNPIKLPDKFKDAIGAMPEYSYGVQRIVVTLDDGKKVWDVFVAGDNEIVRVGTKAEVPFDPAELSRFIANDLTSTNIKNEIIKHTLRIKHEIH